MAWPWDDDDARANSSDLDELIRAYGRGEIDLPWGGGDLDQAPPLGSAPAGVTYRIKPVGIARNDVPPPPMVQFSGPTAAERQGGLGALDPTPVSFAGVQSLPILPPMPLPITPGAPNQIGKALSDIWNDISGRLAPRTGDGAASPNPNEKECWDLHMDDTAQCNRVTKRYGSDAGETCHKTASERYGECLQGGPGRVRTPLYRGW